jgi:predicted MPP superfamily phosphohydrolase
MWLFRSGIIIVYTGLCLYAGIQVFVRFFLLACKAPVFWLVFVLLFYCFILINLFRLDRFQVLRRAGLYSLAVIAYLLPCLALFDVIRLALWLYWRNVLTGWFSAIGLGAIICLAFVIVVYGVLHVHVIHTVIYQATIPKRGPETRLRIALISDLHIGATVGRDWVARIVDAVNRVEPDMVCIAGDIFDGGLDMVHDMPDIAAELRRMTASYGVYACLGNHDVDQSDLFQGSGGTERITAFLSEANIVLLQDEVQPVAEGLWVAGRRDALPIGMRQERLSAAAITASADRADTLIMLDHQPLEFLLIEEGGVDLLLCGHTHKGQLFPVNLATRSIFKKAGAIHYGYWQGKTMRAVVTSGAGLWGLPLRVATNSEVAVIELRFAP